jgi:hypothetical protein
MSLEKSKKNVKFNKPDYKRFGQELLGIVEITEVETPTLFFTKYRQNVKFNDFFINKYESN